MTPGTDRQCVGRRPKIYHLCCVSPSDLLRTIHRVWALQHPGPEFEKKKRIVLAIRTITLSYNRRLYQFFLCQSLEQRMLREVKNHPFV